MGDSSTVAVITNDLLEVAVHLSLDAIGQLVADLVWIYVVYEVNSFLLDELANAAFPAKKPQFGDFAVADSLFDKTLPEALPISASPGTKMIRMMGRRARVRATVAWQSDLRHTTEDTEVNNVPTTVDRYAVDVMLSIGQAFGGTDGLGKIKDVILIIADGKTLWKKGKDSSFNSNWDSVTVHLGGASQAPDSFLESAIGSGKVPGFRNTAYVVIENWKLADWGNRIPATINIIVQPDDDGYTLADGVADIWDRVPNLDSSQDLMLSTLTGKNTIEANGDGDYLLQGFQYEGPVSPIQVFDLFATIFDLTIRHSDGKLEFLDRGDEDVVSVPAGDLAASDSKAGDNRPVQLRDIDVRKRPSSVSVNYLEKGSRYQKQSERYQINVPPSGENVSTINYSGVLKPNQARRIAKRRVIEAYRLKHSASFSLGPQYITTEAGDLVAIPFNGQTLYVRAQEVTVGANYVVQIEGVVEDVRAGDEEILTTPAGDIGTDHDDPNAPDDGSDNHDPEGPDDGGYLPPLLVKAPMNLPPLFTDKEAKNAAIYYAHCAQNPNATWKGAKAYLSWKSSGGYKLIGSGFAEASIGMAVSALADSTAGAGRFFDPDGSFRVQFFNGAPTSATRAEVESGKNWLALYNSSDTSYEILAFTTATAVGETTTDLTGLDLTVAPGGVVSKTGGPRFGVDLGIAVGDFVRFDGFEEDENADIFREVLAVTDDDVTLDIDPGDFVAEGPLDSSTAADVKTNGGVYELSGLFRGMRDTFDHCDGHAVGDLAVILSLSTVQYDDEPKGKIKKTAHFKSVPKGQDLTDVNAESVTFEGETLRPFRPCWLKAERQAVFDALELEWTLLGDIEFSWVHRTRFPFPDPTTTEIPPHDLDHEGKKDEYVLNLYSDSGRTTLVRSISVEAPDDHDPGDSPERRTHTYTVAQQTADAVLGAELWGEIHEVGSVVKAGNQLLFHVDPA